MSILIEYPVIKKIGLMQPCSLTHSTDIVMKECAAYGGVTAHSQMEDVYENPQ